MKKKTIVFIIILILVVIIIGAFWFINRDNSSNNSETNNISYFTKDSTIGDVINNEAFAGFGDLISNSLIVNFIIIKTFILLE